MDEVNNTVVSEEFVEMKDLNRDLTKGEKIGWWFLGFLHPIVGIILYFVWRNERPKLAYWIKNAAMITIGIIIAVAAVMAVIFICNWRPGKAFADVFKFEFGIRP